MLACSTAAAAPLSRAKMSKLLLFNVAVPDLLAMG
jgi:hypothetical protein